MKPENAIALYAAVISTGVAAFQILQWIQSRNYLFVRKLGTKNEYGDKIAYYSITNRSNLSILISECYIYNIYRSYIWPFYWPKIYKIRKNLKLVYMNKDGHYEYLENILINPGAILQARISEKFLDQLNKERFKHNFARRTAISLENSAKFRPTIWLLK